MIRIRTLALVLVLGILSCALTACNVSQDAIAASRQMTDTAACLSDFYSALATSVSDTIDLYELDGAISGIPFAAADRKLPEDTLAELKQRKHIAESLAALAASMTKLSSPDQAADVATAAGQLGKELVTVKALPSGSPIPDALSKASGMLMQLVQQRDERKAALAMDQTLQALAELFEKEKPLYDSLTATHLRQASQVAQDLINANQVDPTPMLDPALRPFALQPLPPTPAIKSALTGISLARLQRKTGDAIVQEAAASTAMLSSLREMSSRVHRLATEKRMPLRGSPVTLKSVEDWAQSLVASKL